MKKKIIALLMILVMIASTPVLAEEGKMYGSKGELFAFTRESLTLYSDAYGSSDCGSVPRHKGMKVLDKSGSYYEVTFKHKGKTKTGYISKEDFRDMCLKYDGSEITNVTNGTYLLGGQEVVVENLGGNWCYLYLKEGEKYFTASDSGVLLLKEKRSETKKDKKSKQQENYQLWKMSRKDHKLLIKNKATKTYLVPSGDAINLGSEKEAMESGLNFIRTNRSLSPYRDFLQYDGRWGAKKYGDSSPMCSGGCGVLAVVNMIYALSGQFAPVMDVADFAVVNHYRVPDNGTDEDFAKAFVKIEGKKYGIKYTGKAPGVSAVKKCLENGGVCVAHVPGHYVAIAAYDKKKDKYLVLDSHPLPKRRTTPYGTWVSRERLEIGYLNCYSSYKFEHVDESDFTWDVEKQDSAIVKKAVIRLKISKTEQLIKEFIAKGLK